jgi:hypothetical protein
MNKIYLIILFVLMSNVSALDEMEGYKYLTHNHLNYLGRDTIYEYHIYGKWKNSEITSIHFSSLTDNSKQAIKNLSSNSVNNILAINKIEGGMTSNSINLLDSYIISYYYTDTLWLNFYEK